MKTYHKVFLPLLLAVLLILGYSYATPHLKTNKLANTNNMTDFKKYIITLKESASTADLSTVKEKVTSLGGSILDEYSLIKGFLIKLPAIHSSSIGEHDLIATIEEDKEVHIQ